MIRGSCLCGRVAFELARVVGPFELCHCPRCRKVSGSAFMAGVGVKVEDFRYLSGEDAIETFALTVREAPPPYTVAFCRHCGSPVPRPPDSGWFEIAAGLLDDDPGLVPDKQIYVDGKAPWWQLDEGIRSYTAEEIRDYRRALHSGGEPSA